MKNKRKEIKIEIYLLLLLLLLKVYLIKHEKQLLVRIIPQLEPDIPKSKRPSLE